MRHIRRHRSLCGLKLRRALLSYTPPPIVATSGVKPLEPYSRADLSAACSDDNLQSNFAAFNTDCKAHAFVKIVVNDFPSKNPNFEWDNICDKSRNKANEYI